MALAWAAWITNPIIRCFGKHREVGASQPRFFVFPEFRVRIRVSLNDSMLAEIFHAAHRLLN